MKLRVLVFCLLFIGFFSFAVNGKTVDQSVARQAAVAFYFEKVNQIHSLAFKDIIVINEKVQLRNGFAMYYIFNFQAGGWVLVSSDDRAIPVIGYSFEGEYNSENNSCCQKAWMEQIELQIRTLTAEGGAALDEATTQWNYLLSRNESNFSIHKEKVVAPLMLATWDQGKYFNALCPLATGGPDGRALVGCVATSMAQIMFYYRWPVNGNGAHGGISLSTYYYRWNEMLNALGNYNQGVAEISYHAGVAVNMDYGATGSAAFSEDVPTALENHFRYSTDCAYAEKTGHTTSAWNTHLTTNLNAGHPVIYSGSGTDGGHAWICDGFQGTDYYHMNWGWSGYGNGYFYLNDLTVSSTSFNDWQGAVLNIYPLTTSYPTYCSGTTNVNYSFGTIEDGSGPNNYQNNSSCFWLIDPTEVISKITISFNAINTEAVNDYITIYDGDNTGAPVLGVFSGTTLPSSVVTTGDKALVVFTTNSSTTASGWQLEYRSTYPVYCSGITTLTTSSGSIDDGSGTNNYSFNQTCRWRLQPISVGSITINFSDFDVASDDYVKIYDENSGDEVASYFGTSIPAQAVYYTDKILVFFKTNGANNALGWTLNYTSVALGFEENPDVGTISVHPNPASEKVFVDINPFGQQDIKLSIFSIDGRMMFQKNLTGVNAQLTEEIDVSGFARGIYILDLTGKNGSLNTKLIVE